MHECPRACCRSATRRLFSMPSTCGSTIQLRKLREAADKRKAKKQLSLKMPVKKKPAKARTSVETTTTELGEEADLKASKAAPKAPKSCAKGKAKRQAGPAAAEPVPGRGLQSTTETFPPPVAKPCREQPDASAHQERIERSHAPQQQTVAERPSQSATLTAQPQQLSVQTAGTKHRPGWPGWPEESAPPAQPQQVSAQPAAPKHKPGWPGWPGDPAPPAQLQQVSVQPEAHGRRPGWPGWPVAAAESSELQPSATLQSSATASDGSPASAAAAAGGLEPAAIPAQEAAHNPAANHSLQPQAAPASAAATPGTCPPCVSVPWLVISFFISAHTAIAGRGHGDAQQQTSIVTMLRPQGCTGGDSRAGDALSSLVCRCACTGAA